MALLFCDGFDSYAATNLVQMWGTILNGAGPTLGSPGRLGYGQYMNYNSTSGSFNGVAHSMPGAPLTTIIVGAAVNVNNAAISGGVFGFLDNVGNLLCNVIFTASGQVQLNVGGTIPVTSAAGVITAETWFYCEAEITFATTATGSCTLRINGVTVASTSSIITATNGNGCTMVGLGFAGSTNSTLYDDFYALSTVAPNNTFLGDVKVLPIYPNGNGRVSGFSRFGGNSSGNFTAVDENPPDGDTSYVFSNVVGTEDAYTLSSISNIATVVAVQVNAFARKDDTPLREIELGVGNGTTEVFGGQNPLNITYVYVTEQLDQNPLTSAAWAVGDFTTLQAAVKISG